MKAFYFHIHILARRMVSTPVHVLKS